MKSPRIVVAAAVACLGLVGAVHPVAAQMRSHITTTTLSQFGNSASGVGTEGKTPTGTGFYLGSFQNSICNFTTQQASDYSANVSWAGSGTGSVSATVAPTTTPCVFAVFGAYAYYAEGTYTPTVSINEITTSSQLMLTPSLAIAEASLSGGTATTGQTCTLFASCSITAAKFSDANSYCNLEQGNAYTVTVNFGDTTSASNNPANTGPVQIAEIGTTCTFTVTATHLYSSPGSKVVTATICDESTSACFTTSTTANPVSAPTISVNTPPSSPPNNGRLSVFAINYQHFTPFPNFGNFTVKLTEYHYSSGANIANLDYFNTAHGIVLSKCATHNAATTQCRAQVLSFTCTSTTATIYLSYQLPNQTTVHYAEITGNRQTQTFTITTDNGAATTIMATPPTQPPAGSVRIIC